MADHEGKFISRDRTRGATWRSLGQPEGAPSELLTIVFSMVAVNAVDRSADQRDPSGPKRFPMTS